MDFINIDIPQLQLILKQGICLLVLVGLNIILGSLDSFFKQQFDKAKFTKGILKGFIISFVFVIVVIIGSLNADIAVVQVNDQTVDLATATHLLIISAYGWYAKEVWVKLTKVIMSKYKTDENKSEVK